MAQASVLLREEYMVSSPYLPESFGRGSPSDIGSALEFRRGQRAITRYGIRTAVNLAFEQMDSQAAADATRFSLEEEISVLTYGKALAGDDPVAQQLVVRKVAALANRDDRRLNRRYG